jgi:hypothetical protein
MASKSPQQGIAGEQGIADLFGARAQVIAAIADAPEHLARGDAVVCGP